MTGILPETVIGFRFETPSSLPFRPSPFLCVLHIHFFLLLPRWFALFSQTPFVLIDPITRSDCTKEGWAETQGGT